MFLEWLVPAEENLQTLLASIHLPALRALRLEVGWDAKRLLPLRPFLAAHSAQLTALVCNCTAQEVAALVADMHFPALRILALPTKSPELLPLLQKATELSHLYLHHTNLLPQLSAKLLSAVRILRLEELDHAELNAVAELPNLEALLLPPYCPIELLPRALQRKVVRHVCSNLSQATALRELVVPIPPPAEQVHNCLLALPALETLRCVESEPLDPAWPVITAAAPRLRHLDLRFWSLDRESYAAVRTTLDLAVRGGVESVALYLKAAPGDVLAELCAWAAAHLWLRLAVVSGQQCLPDCTLADLDPDCFAVWTDRIGFSV